MTLIERLRKVGKDYDFHDNALIYEAADAIEALQAENEQWKVDFNEMKIDHDALAAKLVPLTDAEISLMAHNEDDGDWNSLGYRGCWHRGYFAGARAIEAAHGIQAIDAAKGGQHEDA